MPAKGHTSSVYRKRDQGSASRGLVCKQPAPCPKGPGNQGQVKWCHMVIIWCQIQNLGIVYASWIILASGHQVTPEINPRRPTPTHLVQRHLLNHPEPLGLRNATTTIWAPNGTKLCGKVVEDHGGPMPAPKKSLAMSSLWFPWGFSLKICLPNPFSRISPSQQHPLLLPEEEGKNGPVEHQTGQEPTPGRATCFIAGEKKKNLAKYTKLSH